MLESTNASSSKSFLELDSSLKLLVVFAIFCISIALLQSDRIAAAARRGVNNAITLAVLLVDDMLAGIQILSTSPRTHQVLQGAQKHLFKLMKAVQATVMLAIQHAEIQRRAQSVIPLIERAVLRSVGAAHVLAGHARAFLAFTLVLISIVLHAIVNYLRDFAATTDFTAIILSAGNFVLKNILNFYDLLYNVLAILGMYSATAEAWFTTHISVPALSVGFANLTWIPLKTAATWLCSVWETLDIFAPFQKMAQELEAVYEIVFGTGDVNDRTFGETTTPAARLNTPREPVAAIEEQITTMTPKHDTPHDDSTISAFTDLIQKLTKIEELQEQMKKTDERLDIVVDELQTCTLLILRLKRTLAEFVEEHYE
ncbi:unnamed protein product [Aureobasidium pullulans]|nr:unnamed protein product [Aureobasidium pullulans]